VREVPAAAAAGRLRRLAAERPARAGGVLHALPRHDRAHRGRPGLRDRHRHPARVRGRTPRRLRRRPLGRRGVARRRHRARVLPRLHPQVPLRRRAGLVPDDRQAERHDDRDAPDQLLRPGRPAHRRVGRRVGRPGPPDPARHRARLDPAGDRGPHDARRRLRGAERRLRAHRPGEGDQARTPARPAHPEERHAARGDDDRPPGRPAAVRRRAHRDRLRVQRHRQLPRRLRLQRRLPGDAGLRAHDRRRLRAGEPARRRVVRADRPPAEEAAVSANELPVTDGAAAAPLHASIHGDGPAGADHGGEGVWARAWRTLRRNPVAIIGFVIVAVFVLVAVLAPLLAPYAGSALPGRADVRPTLIPGPSAEYPLGLDRYGGDVLSKLIWGAQASLLVGVLSTLFRLTGGLLLGLLAGWFGKWVDFAVMRLVDLMLSVPSLLLAVSIAAIVGQSSMAVIIAIGVVQVPIFARLLRGSMLAQKGQDYVLAASALGLTRRSVTMSHVLPNSVGPVIV